MSCLVSTNDVCIVILPIPLDAASGSEMPHFNLNSKKPEARWSFEMLVCPSQMTAHRSSSSQKEKTLANLYLANTEHLLHWPQTYIRTRTSLWEKLQLVEMREWEKAAWWWWFEGEIAFHILVLVSRLIQCTLCFKAKRRVFKWIMQRDLLTFAPSNYWYVHHYLTPQKSMS